MIIIDQQQQQQQNAIDSLEICNGLVKCQGKCGSLYPLIKNSNLVINSKESNRIDELRRRIEYAKKYHSGHSGYRIECKNNEQELKDLLEQEEKRDILRRLPGFYSTKITDYKFVCSKCWDELYYSVYVKNKKKAI